MSRSPPLRFLLLLLAGWAGIRAAWLAPGWWAEPAEAGAARPVRRPSPLLVSRPITGVARSPSRTREAIVRAAKPGPLSESPSAAPPRIASTPSSARPWRAFPWQLPQGRTGRPNPIPDGRAGPPSAGRPAGSRWAFAAWSFLRRGDGAALVPGGILGGSQIGARADYRLNSDPVRPLALAVRLAAPVRRPAGAEAALGIDWRPSRQVPVHFLAERRQALGREGRSAFGLTLYGGVSDAPLAGLRVDAYGQAGIVGTRSRDPFGDGAVRLSVPLRRLRLGAGAWAAAQPGLARLDLGPQALLRLPLAGRNVAIAADWRFRIAGDARPGSGPALTIASDF